jgi:hypothetical protein
LRFGDANLVSLSLETWPCSCLSLGEIGHLSHIRTHVDRTGNCVGISLGECEAPSCLMNGLAQLCLIPLFWARIGAHFRALARPVFNLVLLAVRDQLEPPPSPPPIRYFTAFFFALKKRAFPDPFTPSPPVLLAIRRVYLCNWQKTHHAKVC